MIAPNLLLHRLISLFLPFLAPSLLHKKPRRPCHMVQHFPGTGFGSCREPPPAPPLGNGHLPHSHFIPTFLVPTLQRGNAYRIFPWDKLILVTISPVSGHDRLIPSLACGCIRKKFPIRGTGMHSHAGAWERGDLPHFPLPLAPPTHLVASPDSIVSSMSPSTSR